MILEYTEGKRQREQGREKDGGKRGTTRTLLHHEESDAHTNVEGLSPRGPMQRLFRGFTCPWLLPSALAQTTQHLREPPVILFLVAYPTVATIDRQREKESSASVTCRRSTCCTGPCRYEFEPFSFRRRRGIILIPSADGKIFERFFNETRTLRFC